MATDWTATPQHFHSVALTGLRAPAPGTDGFFMAPALRVGYGPDVVLIEQAAAVYATPITDGENGTPAFLLTPEQAGDMAVALAKRSEDFADRTMTRFIGALVTAADAGCTVVLNAGE